MSKLGTKETKEVLMAGNEISLFIISRVKDGVGMDDAMAVATKLMMDSEFKKLISNAVDGIKSVPAEIKDLDLQEGLELGMYQAKEVGRILDALKK